MKKKTGRTSFAFGLVLVLALPTGGAAEERLSAAASAALTDDECATLARKNGDGNGPFKLPGSCLDRASASAPSRARRSGPEGLVSSAGYRNILVTDLKATPEGKSQQLHLAGKQTSLKSIWAIAVLEKERELFILDPEARAVLVFRADLSGNIAPIRSFQPENVETATSLAADAKARELYVINGEDASYQVFRLQADRDGRRTENGTSPLRKVRGSSTGMVRPEDIAVAAQAGEVLVLDRDANQVLVFSRSSEGDVAPLRRIRGPSTQISSPVRIDYVERQDEIRVTNQDGTILSFKRDADGDASPLGSK